MIIGYKKVKDCAPGTLVRFQSGQYAVISEYGSNDRSFHDTILLEDGEYFNWLKPDEWVAIIDLDEVETEAIQEVDYPKVLEAVKDSEK